MPNVVQFAKHYARASTGWLKLKSDGSASLPLARRACEKPQKCSAGIFPLAFQLEGALDDSTPAIEQAAEFPPTASITASTVKRISVTHRDNSRNVSMSSPHIFGLGNLPTVRPSLVLMYSKSKTAQRLVQTQAALELTNQAIADEIGVASNAWAQYRTAKRTIPHKVIVGLKEKFGVTSDWILAGDPSGLPQRLYTKIRVAA